MNHTWEGGSFERCLTQIIVRGAEAVKAQPIKELLLHYPMAKAVGRFERKRCMAVYYVCHASGDIGDQLYVLSS
jgi:hypothetical protein